MQTKRIYVTIGKPCESKGAQSHGSKAFQAMTARLLRQVCLVLWPPSQSSVGGLFHLTIFSLINH